MVRKKIIITIDKKLLEKLKNQAIHFGDISHTIEDALNFYFSHLHTQKKMKIYKSYTRSYNVYLAIINYLINHWNINYPEIKTIPLNSVFN